MEARPEFIPLGERCISHLKNESTILQLFVEVCSRIRESLGIHDDAKIEELKREQAAIEAKANEIQSTRISLRDDIASALQRNVEATSIKSLEDYLPQEMAAEIEVHRQKIEALTEEIRTLSQTNAVLLQHNIDIFRRLILTANGQAKNSCPTYSSKGKLQNSKIKVPISIASE